MASTSPVPRGGKSSGFVPRPTRQLALKDLAGAQPYSASPPGGGRIPRAPHDLPLPGPKNDLKPTPGKTPAPSRTILPKIPPKRKPSYTAAQEATMHAKALLAPLYAQADTEANRQNAAINAYTKEVMQQLAGVAPQIGQDFNSAINAQSGLVNSAADSLRAANPNGDAQKLLDAIGAPQSQHDATATNLANVFGGGAAVTQYNQGALPLGALRSQGLASETLARLAPGNAALGGRQSLLSALAQQSDARAKIGEQLPSLSQDWLNSFNSNKYKGQQIALETAYKNAQLGQGQQRINQGTQRLQQGSQRLAQQQDQFVTRQNQQIEMFNARQTNANAKLELPNSSLSGKVGYLVDSSGAPIVRNGKIVVLPGNRIVNGRIVKVGSKKNPPRLTASQVQKYRGIAETVAQNGHAGFTDSKGTVHPPLTLADAWEEMRKEGIPETIALRALRRAYNAGQGVPSGTNVNPGTNPNAQGPPLP